MIFTFIYKICDFDQINPILELILYNKKSNYLQKIFIIKYKQMLNLLNTFEK